MDQSRLKSNPSQLFKRSEGHFITIDTMPQALLMVVVTTLVGLTVRLFFLGSKSIWLDEALSILQAIEPELLWGSGFDPSHPPLYATLLHYWLPLGDSEFVLRLSSALIGSITIPLSYALALGLGGRRVAYTTAWLAALSPLLVWYAQELRSYSLVVVFGLVASLALIRLITRPQGWWGGWWWLLFVIAMSAALYTHYAALLLVAAQLGIVAVLYLQQRATRKGVLLWLCGWPMVALLYWPWLVSPGMEAFAKLTFSSNLYPVELVATRFAISPLVAGWIVALLSLLATLVVLVVAYSMLRRGLTIWNRWAATPIVRYGALILFLAIVIISVVPRLYTMKKLVIALWPYGLLAMAWIFPWRLSNRIPLILLLTTSLVGSLVNVTVIPKDQWREMVAYLAEHGEATDSIWIEPRYHMFPLNYYLAHPDQVNAATSSPLNFDIGNVPPTMSDAELEALVGRGQRVWLIYHAANYIDTDPERRLEKWLAEHLEATDQLHLYRIEATLYSPR